MSAKAEYRRVLSRLAQKELVPFLRIIGETISKRTISKRYRDKQLAEIQKLAQQIKMKRVRRNVSKRNEIRTVSFRIGTRPASKTEILLKRFGRRRSPQHLVYVMWDKNGDCLKVGRSYRGIGRVTGQKDTYYFRAARRIRIYSPKRKGKRYLPMLECILTHIYEPKKNTIKPSKRKYSRECPFHRINNLLEREIQKRFPAK